jgi:hypothetical protein
MTTSRTRLPVIVAFAGAVMMALFATCPTTADEEGRVRQTVCVAPLKTVPPAKMTAALNKVFGTRLQITVNDALKVVIFRGSDSAVKEGIAALKDSIDTTRRRGEDDDDEGGRFTTSVELVRLRRVEMAPAVALIKEIVSDKLEITERSAAGAVIIEGERHLVEQAVSLLLQIDGQHMHPDLRRLI